MRQKGFTLIELLVVIAIIAILAAILFPVFSAAREKARQTMCASNEKQLALAMVQYVQDNDEMFPGLVTYNNAPTHSGYGGDWGPQKNLPVCEVDRGIQVPLLSRRRCTELHDERVPRLRHDHRARRLAHRFRHSNKRCR